MLRPQPTESPHGTLHEAAGVSASRAGVSAGRPGGDPRAMRLLSAFTLAWCLFLPAARADVAVLENGNRLEGSVEELPSGEVAIHSALGTLRLPAHLVARIERGTSLEEEARAALDRLSPQDVEARYRLALRLRGEGAGTMARRVLEEILRLEPDHAGARRELGYVQCDGEWLPEDRCHELRGEVHYEGRWIDASEWALLRRLEMEREESRLAQLRAEARLEAARLAEQRRLDLFSPYPYYYPPFFGTGVVVPFLTPRPLPPEKARPPAPPSDPSSGPAAVAAPRHLRSGFRPPPTSPPASSPPPGRSKGSGN